MQIVAEGMGEGLGGLARGGGGVWVSSRQRLKKKGCWLDKAFAPIARIDGGGLWGGCPRLVLTLASSPLGVP